MFLFGCGKKEEEKRKLKEIHNENIKINEKK